MESDVTDPTQITIILPPHHFQLLLNFQIGMSSLITCNLKYRIQLWAMEALIIFDSEQRNIKFCKRVPVQI